MEQDIIKEVMMELLEEEKISNIKLDELKKQVSDVFKFLRENSKSDECQINAKRVQEKMNQDILYFQMQLAEMKNLIAVKKKKETLRQKFNLVIPWAIVIVLSYIIFRIAIGGHFYGSLF